MNRNILVFGGSRYAGEALVRRLVLEGNRVTVATRSPETLSDLCVTIHRTDRKSGAEVAALLQRVKPEIIIDMICFDADDVNALLEGCTPPVLKQLTHYIMVSTFFVYHHLNNHEAPVTAIPETEDRYTQNKMTAEQILMAGPLASRLTIARLPFILSADDYTGRFQTAIAQVKSGRVRLTSEDRLAMHIIGKEDAAAALTALAYQPPQSIIDLANPGIITAETLYREIASALEIPLDIQRSSESSEAPYQVACPITLPLDHQDRVGLTPSATAGQIIYESVREYERRSSL